MRTEKFSVGNARCSEELRSAGSLWVPRFHQSDIHPINGFVRLHRQNMLGSGAGNRMSRYHFTGSTADNFLRTNRCRTLSFQIQTREPSLKLSSDSLSDEGSSAPASIGTHIIDGKPYELCTALVKAPPQLVWEVLTDYAQVTQMFAYMKKSAIVETRGDIKIVEQEVQPLPPIPAIKYSVEVKETHLRLLEWRGLTDYVKVNQGYVGLEPADKNTTSVTYGMCIEGLLLIPATLIRHQLRIIMPQILQIIKARAEGLQQNY